MTFEQWWEQFPNKMGAKETARAAWNEGRNEERRDIEKLLKRNGPISEFEDPRD